MGNIIKFTFYAIYLWAAELPILLILFLRSWENANIHIAIKYLTVGSLIINIILCVIILSYKKDSIMNNEITDLTPNNSSISDFFSFFLLPFFTFSFSNDLHSSRFFLELGILFALLTILLYKTRNLSSNIIFYLLFNNYNVKTVSQNNIRFLVLNDLNFEDYNQHKDVTIKINRKFYIYYGSKKRLYINFAIAIIILLTILVLIMFSNKLFNLTS